MNDIEKQKFITVIEAVLYASSEPVSVKSFKDKIFYDTSLTTSDIKSLLQDLATRFEGRGIRLDEVASGWRLVTVESVNDYVARLFEEPPQKYHRATLETLSLIAYKQPITRAEIEDIREVAVNSNIIKTLIERGWVRVVARKEVPGRPALFGTTKTFLDDLNLVSLSDLPAIPEFTEDSVLMKQPEQMELVEGAEDPSNLAPEEKHQEDNSGEPEVRGESDAS